MCVFGKGPLGVSLLVRCLLREKVVEVPVTRSRSASISALVRRCRSRTPYFFLMIDCFVEKLFCSPSCLLSRSLGSGILLTSWKRGL